MDLESFVSNFAAEFPESPRDRFNAETRYRELDEWDSLATLTIISMVDEKYGLRITGNELRACTTIGELYDSLAKLHG